MAREAKTDSVGESARRQTFQVLRQFREEGWTVEGSLTTGYTFSLPARSFKISSVDICNSSNPPTLERKAEELYGTLLTDFTFYDESGRKLIFDGLQPNP